MRRATRIILLPLLLALAGQTSAPAPPEGVDEALWRRMVQADARARRVEDLTADFEQRKFTPLLRRPLVSSGKVRLRGGVMRWDTHQPEPTVLRIEGADVRIYYPRQKVVEAYRVEEKLGALAASPAPRLEVLVRYFTFAEMDVKELGAEDDQKHLALRMIPADSELKKHVEEVRVLIDVTSGLLRRMEMVDSDGDRTVMSFSNVRANVGLKEQDVALAAPSGVKVTRPLAGLEQEQKK